MLKEKLVSVQRPQESARPRLPLWNVLCSTLVLGIAAAWAAPLLAAPARVTAPDGTFEGKFDTTGTMREFLGIRYAQPVTGNLRWKAPQPVRPSVATQDATQFGNHCPQTAGAYGNPTSTEDCLFLNVFAPNSNGDHDRGRGNDDKDAHPVMVWIHGGSLVVGESDIYDASKLVQRGVVVVTINYRLGALGFLAHPALTGDSPDHVSGNYGIQDQQAALKWVRRNIRAFGGDPDKVTIFGESAGGLSTFVNLVSPTAHGLFHRAIVESGAYMQTQPTLAQTEARGARFAAAVGCNQPNPTDVLTCLRGLSVSTILANQSLTLLGSGAPPNVDGKVLTQSVGAALASGQFNRVPLMNGTNRDEWRLFVGSGFDLAGGPVTAATYVSAIAATIGNAAAAPQVASHYQVPAQFPSFDHAVGAVGTDTNYACPARFVDELASQFVATFAYEFNDENAPQNFLPPMSIPYGSSHASEIQYLFPVANPSGFGLNLPQTPLDANQHKLSDRMVGYWTEFARGGDPNGHGQPHWPRFRRNHQVYLSLVPPSPITVTNFETAHQCDFWDTLTGRTLPPGGGHDQHADND
ncbi:carboxylesterase family protein [Bradyrhizobium sp. Leo170]|uniref:carboxylesterase/lipase family protein n=1 Tax=Bradyrhizobium sp. Leo170 TaxID=1571199 RepID=UPI0013EEB2A3|nr:carboxylesterase family protein [Bradyrhizobium sp. Leo170]